MDVLIFHLEQINWVAVVIATVVGWLVGAVWYSKALFSKPWNKAAGIKPKDNKKGNAVPIVVSLLMTFVAATGIATLMCALDLTNWQQGVGLGLLVGLVFVAAITTVQYVFDFRKGASTIYLIDTSYNVLLLAIIGGIIGAL